MPAHRALACINFPFLSSPLIFQNFREQSLARVSASATLNEEGKQAKLGRRQIEAPPLESNCEFALINLKSAHFQNLVVGAGAQSPQEGLNAQNQLARSLDSPLAVSITMGSAAV